MLLVPLLMDLRELQQQRPHESTDRTAFSVRQGRKDSIRYEYVLIALESDSQVCYNKQECCMLFVVIRESRNKVRGTWQQNAQTKIPINFFITLNFF